MKSFEDGYQAALERIANAIIASPDGDFALDFVTRELKDVELANKLSRVWFEGLES